MKLLSLILAFGAVALATAAPETPTRADCQRCNDMYNVCVLNGHTEGQTGCKATCRDRACDQNAGCREECGEMFATCPEKRRWLN